MLTRVTGWKKTIAVSLSARKHYGVPYPSCNKVVVFRVMLEMGIRRSDKRKKRDQTAKQKLHSFIFIFNKGSYTNLNLSSSIRF